MKKSKEKDKYTRTLKDLMDMSGRTVLITGAAGSLGCIISDTIAELGANLFLIDRPESDFDKLKNILSNHNAREVFYLTCDLEDQVERNNLFNEIKSYTNNINVLINNAAYIGASNLDGWNVPFEQQSVETWNRALEVNLTAAFDLSKQFSKLLRKSGNANIINVGSIYGLLGPNWNLYEGTTMSNPAAYAVSKGGLIQLTRWLATSLAPDIRVNCVSPGGILRNQPKDFIEKYQAMTPLGRMAQEEDFRGVFAYLASDLSKYVTGQNLIVDGGWAVW